MADWQELERRITRLETRRQRFIQVGLVWNVAGFIDQERSLLTPRVIISLLDETVRGASAGSGGLARNLFRPLAQPIFESARVGAFPTGTEIARAMSAALGFGARGQAIHALQGLANLGAASTKFLGYSNPVGWIISAAAQPFLGGLRGLPRNVLYIDEDNPNAQLGVADIIIANPLRVLSDVPVVTPTFLLRNVRRGIPFTAPPILPFQTEIAVTIPNRYIPEIHHPSPGDVVYVLSDGEDNYFALGIPQRIPDLEDLTAEDFGLTDEQIQRIRDAN